MGDDALAVLDATAQAELVRRGSASPRELVAAAIDRIGRLDPELDALVRDPRILDAVEDLLGPDLLCWGAQFFAKPAGDAAYVSWHQDATYWGLSSPDVVTAWVALTPSVHESGCMQVVPGTHHAQVQHEDRFDDANLLSRGQEIAAACGQLAAEN